MGGEGGWASVDGGEGLAISRGVVKIFAGFAERRGWLAEPRPTM